jgi:hypothetical protein
VGDYCGVKSHQFQVIILPVTSAMLRTIRRESNFPSTIASIVRWSRKPTVESFPPWCYMRPSSHMVKINQGVEEETLPGYERDVYYPVKVGQIVRGTYQILGKLGYGAYSTVSLCRDLEYVLFCH